MAVQERTSQRNAVQSNPDIERIYHEGDAALPKSDGNAILALYAPDGELQSPLVTHLLNKEEGVCRGQSELKRFFDILATRKPASRQFYRRRWRSKTD
jgi:predicted component of type VI protein secretion system